VRQQVPQLYERVVDTRGLQDGGLPGPLVDPDDDPGAVTAGDDHL
jgi:hypothetical protein